MAGMYPWSEGVEAARDNANRALAKEPTLSTGMFEGSFDSSNWNVNIGSGTVSSSAQKSSALGIDALFQQLLGSPLLLIGGALLAVYLFKK